jgi:hypothetical protein
MSFPSHLSESDLGRTIATLGLLHIQSQIDSMSLGRRFPFPRLIMATSKDPSPLDYDNNRLDRITDSRSMLFWRANDGISIIQSGLHYNARWTFSYRSMAVRRHDATLLDITSAGCFLMALFSRNKDSKHPDSS